MLGIRMLRGYVAHYRHVGFEALAGVAFLGVTSVGLLGVPGGPLLGVPTIPLDSIALFCLSVVPTGNLGSVVSSSCTFCLGQLVGWSGLFPSMGGELQVRRS